MRVAALAPAFILHQTEADLRMDGLFVSCGKHLLVHVNKKKGVVVCLGLHGLSDVESSLIMDGMTAIFCIISSCLTLVFGML